ncbi:alginate export family protein [Mucilaginibacter gynuensis]|uniref:Alginate export family protein n=1 Tax=Mucilaginibacter gynuensis TaxID=1302236 RepID=A0ABP8GY50_9SPHI
MQAQSFKLLRYNEDYSSLKDSSKSLYNKLKFLPVTTDNSIHLSFGGEIRNEFGGKIDEDWIKDQGYNYSILQRYSLHADLHAGSRFRLFAQLNSALESGSKYRPGPTDEDKLNVQNLFGEYKILKDPEHQLSFRLGRQEINYGSGRLISVRDGNTTRQYFTGAKLLYTTPYFALDAFVMAADEINFGVFDNRTNRQANLWGTYSNIKLKKARNLDLYYLGTRRDNAEFEEGREREIRHTLAARYWKNSEGFTYNLEAAYQFGKFGEGNISAWTTAIELGYTFDDVKFKPSINLRNDYISGDKHNGDGKLQTFNPLYPKGGYFGFNPLIGPSNLIDIHPYLILAITDRLSMQGDLVFNWRYSLQDGLYRPSGSFNTTGSGSGHRFIGTTYLLSADFQFNKYLSLSCGGQYFKVGGFIKDIKPLWANSKYFNAQLSFKF